MNAAHIGSVRFRYYTEHRFTRSKRWPTLSPEQLTEDKKLIRQCQLYCSKPNPPISSTHPIAVAAQSAYEHLRGRGWRLYTVHVQRKVK